MDLLDKLKSTVSSALQVNILAKDFELGPHVASGGPGLSWKIYDAVKKTTKQEASVFIFEKKSLERYSRNDKEKIIEVLKKGSAQLTKLRHPKILSVIQPLEESRETLCFATERIFASLANLLGNSENLPTPPPPAIKDHKLYEVEIKYGLLQLTEGLAFLHNDAKILHRNICPDSIYINKDGVWKIAGFDMCVTSSNPQDQAAMFNFVEWNPDIPPMIQPRLEYLAPEYGITMTCDSTSDMYSVGILMYTLFNKGRPLFECSSQWSVYKKNIIELRDLKITTLGCVPEEVREHVKMLLNVEPALRPDADQLVKIPFFEDVGCMTLQYLDNLFQRDNLQKSHFFKGLPKIIAKMPKRVSLQRILPCLYKEVVNPEMVPFLLPSILLIAEQASDQEYVNHILPQLIPLFKIKEPMQVTLLFLQNMNLLLSKTPSGDIKAYVLPMLYGALENNSPQIQELCLNILPTFANLIEFSSLKNAVMPRIKKTTLSTSSLSVRVSCLLCLGKLMEYMDKWTVLDDLLPMLPQIPSKEPAVLMSVLGIYQVALTHKKLGITKEILSHKVLPFIIPLSMENSLNLHQFNAYMGVIKEMLSSIEMEQRAKLEQLNAMKEEQKTLQFSEMEQNGQSTGSAGDLKQESMMDKFITGFGLGSFFTGKSVAKTEDVPRSNSSSAQYSSPPVSQGTSSAAAVPKHQAKVSLTIEEKQRLAREQEQQQRFKSQKPLVASGSAGSVSQSSGKEQSKDLTASLLSSNLSGLQQGKPQTSAYSSAPGQNYGFGQTAQNTNYSVSNQGVNPKLSSFGMSSPAQSSSYGNFSSVPQSGSYGMGSMGMGTAQPKTANMSAFDNILPLPASQQKIPMNQMQQQTGGTMMGQQNLSMQQGMMGRSMQQGMMGQHNMQQGMLGNLNYMSFQGNQTGFTQTGMMGNVGMHQPSSMGFQQPPKQTSQLSKTDIDDLLG